jgi:hypothetical protein
MKQAYWGPKQRKAFQGKSWQLIIAVAALLFSFSATAQKRSNLQQINATGYTYKAGEYRVILYLPLDSMHSADSGAIAYKNGKLWIAKDTLHWQPYGKAIQLTDSSFIVGVDTITIHGTGSGGGVTLTNATGAGDTLITAANKIKRIDHDATLVISTNANKLLIGADTISYVASISKLRDTALVLRAAIASGGGVIRTVSANTSAAANDQAILCNTASGNITVTITTSTVKRLSIQKTSSDFNTVIISPSSGTIRGSSSFTLTGTWESVTIITDGTNFFIL